MSDLIDRQSVIDALSHMCSEDENGITVSRSNVNSMLRVLPSAQLEPSEITDEQAILHLQSTGWMQNHDKEMYEKGLRERLADDSDSYDSLIPSGDTILRQAAIDTLYHVDEYNGRSIEAIRNLPSAQPEIIYCEDCKYTDEERIADGRHWCILNNGYFSYCSEADRRTDGN